MKIIYIAGPFRAPTQWTIAENIRAAEKIGLLVAYAGAMPLIPHANTAHFHGLIHDQFWIDGTKELLARCDGAIFIPRWRSSEGSRGEYEWCEENSLPVLKLDEVPPALSIEQAVQRYITSLSIDVQEDIAEERRAVGSSAANRVGQDAGIAPAGAAKGRRRPTTR